MKNKIGILLLAAIMASCNNKNDLYDASGTFESTEIIVSSQANGQLVQFAVDEGDTLNAGAAVGYVDSTQLHLTKLQLLENQKAILAGRPDVQSQIDATQKQIDNTLLDKQRIENLVKGNVATQKQLDDVNSKLAVLQAQLGAQRSALNNTTTTLNEQGNAVTAQLALINDQLKKCVIVNPINGTVLASYANTSEVTAMGKPLYKIADMSVMELKAYITGDQFAKVKLGQKVKVLVDDGSSKYRTYEGEVDWISNKSEFTPKTIQTKNERANLVYAIKIKVKNDGYIKIGMYGEVKF
ncbi:MAG: HlyD family efflux transporter periplasmic adaptor subunit [Chitinophagales bacterium]|nr:HlyD family efflux transporter periplasmic adaptor subunit [Chitinophagales bacterium]